MKPLRWFGYKIDDDKWFSTINNALRPFGIFVDEMVLHTHDYSYRELDQFGNWLFFPKGCGRNFILPLHVTKGGFEMLRDWMNDCGFKSMTLVAIKHAPYQFVVEVETWNDFDSIENFLRWNNETV